MIAPVASFASAVPGSVRTFIALPLMRVQISSADDELKLKDKYGSKIDPSGMDVNITDCPYVQVITEDKRDAIARISIRLR